MALPVRLISIFRNSELPSELPLVMWRAPMMRDEGDLEPLESHEAKTVGANATQLGMGYSFVFSHASTQY